MAIHIGRHIKIQAELQKIGATELGKLLNKSRETVYDIFERESVDTELLLACSKVLNHDFFSYYYSQEPLLSFRENETKDLKLRAEAITNELARERRINAVQEELIATQRKNINHLERLLKNTE